MFDVIYTSMHWKELPTTVA